MLPAMNALPVFEAVGRHLSISLAASELNVTPGAVSRQIKNLEQSLGCDLFVRSHHNLEFTPDGSVYWANIKNSLAEISVATDEIAKNQDKKSLVIECPRLFLQKCIMPNLRDFYAKHPGIDVKFVISGTSNLSDHEVDGRIAVGDIASKAVVSEKIVPCDLAIVCSPLYLANSHEPVSVDDLGHHTLLRSAEFTKNWSAWLGEDEAAVFANSRFIDFENAGLELTAAVEGLGIAIVRLNLVQKEIAAGELVALLPERNIQDHYSFFFANTKLHSNKFKMLRRWLRRSLA